MGIANTFAGELLDHLFLNTAIANVGDASGLQPAAAAGSLYLALHTADPGAGGSQNTSEATYGGYARIAIARTSGGFTRTGQTISNTAEVAAPACTSGSETLTHWSIGTASSGAGKILFSGPLATGVKAFTVKTNDTLTIPGNAFAVDDRVVLSSIAGLTFPTGPTAGVVYWVKTVSGDDVTLSATQGGATLDVTAVGSGRIALSKQVSVSAGITPKVAASAMAILLG